MPTLALFLLSALALLLSGLALLAEMRGREAEARYPPIGEFAEIDGVRLHYLDIRPDGWRAGDPALVFVHGASANLRDPHMALAGPLTDRPAEQGRAARLIFVDRPGHGYSQRGGDTMYRPAAQAALIAGLADSLAIERAVAVGHSWGGAVAAQLGLARPDLFAGLVFLAPATHPWPGGTNWYYDAAALPVAGTVFSHTLAPFGAALVAPSAIDGIFRPAEAPDAYGERLGLPLLFRPHTFRANARDVAFLKGEVEAASLRYGEIAQPAAVITGETDGVVYPHIHSHGLARDLPNAWLVTLEGAGHMPHHTRTDAVLAEIAKVVAMAFPEAGWGDEGGRNANETAEAVSSSKAAAASE
ncbi:alpha/beta hydrolase [Stappia sp. WLB 29]|uniref:alpha/beta fold hydrolase n=1 Tax=Stappia sp. WLB 29 TaxID=2925220 RepID=UPI0024BEE01B|nr:alpha/beta hydrolase [Stappia sp. WLB 29]